MSRSLIWILELIFSPRNGRSGEELSQRWGIKGTSKSGRTSIRTQRTKLQSSLLAHVNTGVVQLSKKLIHVEDKGAEGIELQFKDGTLAVADLVVGADGIRSVWNDNAYLQIYRLTKLSGCSRRSLAQI